MSEPSAAQEPRRESSAIEFLAVRNYKSLRDIRFQPKNLSVLVGPNSAGKSNLLDALRFMRDFVEIGQKAILDRHGFNTLVWSGRSHQKIEFELHGELIWDGRGSKFQYFTQLSSDPFDASGNKENFKVYDNSQYRTLLDFPNANRLASLYGLDGRELGASGHQPWESSLRQFSSRPGENQPLGFFGDYLRSWEVYDPTPALMQAPVSAKHDLKLKPHGQNLGGVLHTIRSEHPTILRIIEEHLHVLVPESRSILSLLTDKEKTYPGLEEDQVSLKIPASSMSAGTLRFLAFLAALYSPEAPQLVCFEEPENNIHPRALDLLVEVLKSASAKRQIIISTHSPYLLNSIEPDSVFVFDKKQSETTITPANSTKELNSLLRKVGLGEAWYAGTLGGVPTH